MIKTKNKELKLKIIELEEENKILIQRLKLYENERKKFKENKIINLINLLSKRLEVNISSLMDIKINDDIECLEKLFKLLEV